MGVSGGPSQDTGSVHGKRSRAVLAWALHAWLYYGWPLATVVAVGGLVAARFWWPALLVSIGHVSVWCYLALRGRENLAKWGSPQDTPAPSLLISIVSGGIASMIPCLGLAAAVVIGLLACLGVRRVGRWYYIR